MLKVASVQSVLAVLMIIVCKVSDGHNNSIGPTILTQPSTFRTHLGSDVKLPCNVTNLSDGVLLWKQGSRIFFAGNIKVRRDDRFALDGTSLFIHDVTERDDGEYTCEVETKDKNNPKWISHKLLVLQRPKIVTSSSHSNLTIIKGSSVSLHCAATGNPMPSIVWSKHNQDLAGVEHALSDNGTSLSLHNITTSHAGRYSCTADNGVGNPVLEEILLTVLYPPTATSERDTILGGEECSVELVCQVEGYPRPTVQWYQGTMKLVPNNNIRMSNIGMRYQLSFIRFSFDEKDSLQFSCVASSELGASEAKFNIIGTPGTPVIFENVSEVESAKYKILWTTPSFSNIQEHMLIYKQVKDKKSPSLLTYGENKLRIPNMRKTGPRNCSRRNTPFQNDFNFILDKLEPLTNYQVKIIARNKHGWSNESAPVVFKTSQYLVHPPQESPMLPLSGVKPLWSLKSAISLNFLITIVFVLNVYVCVI